MKQFGGKRKIAFACMCAAALTAGAETTVLNGETKSISSQYTTTGITFTGASSDIVAPVGAKCGSDGTGAKPASEFADFYGISLLSPDGTLPGVVDVSALTDDAVGKISTGLSDLVFDTVDSCVSGERAVDLTTWLGNTAAQPVVYWKNRKLSDIKMVTAITENNSREALARTCFFTNDGQTATMQFQRRMGHETAGNRRRYIIVTGIELKQVGDDITAHVNLGGFVNTEHMVSPYLGECIDFSSVSLKPQSSGPERGDGYYKIRCLLAGEEGANGGKGIEVKTAGFETVCDATNEFSTAVKTPVTYWKNLKLDDIVAMQAETKAASAWQNAYGYFMERTAADTLHVTFQRLAGNYLNGKDYTVSTTIEFKQVGTDVTAQGIDAGYYHIHVEQKDSGHMPREYVMPIPPEKLVSGSYPTRNIRVVTKPKADFGGQVNVAGGVKLTGGGTLQVSAPASGFSSITGNGSMWYHSDYAWNPALSNTFYGVAQSSYDGVTVFDGGYHVVAKAGALPANSTIILTNKATVVTRGSSAKLCVGGNVYVYKGSRLEKEEKGWSLDSLNSIVLLGGRMKVSNQQFYLTYLTLSDGAVVEGITDDGFRFGCEPKYPWIFSVGSQTNRIDCGIRFYRTSGTANEFGTFFTAADLILSAALRSRGDAGYEAQRVKKRGTGKLILAPTCYNVADTVGGGAFTARVEVVEGTLRNESPNALKAVNSVELHCGTAYEAVKEAQTIGALVVDAKQDWEPDSATLKFENGGSLSLPEGGLEIADGSLLVLDGDVAETSFRVGTSATLAKDVLRRVKVKKSGKPRSVLQNEDGYIEQSVGFMMIIR